MTTLARPAKFRGVFRVDDDARHSYAEAAGIARLIPRAVAVPVDPDDLATLVRWAATCDVPLIPRGSGSSMPGGAIGDGVVVDLSRWRAELPVDVEARTIRVGVGMLRNEVDAAARAHGLRFPVDPSSGAFCTVGGMTSTNAAGSHSMRFGPTGPWVRAITCVFDDGSLGEIRRGAPLPRGVPAVDRFAELSPRLLELERRQPCVHQGVIKDVSGYGLAAYARTGDLVDLLIGSEGTLAMFVDVELALAAAAPATSSVLGAFTSLEAAVDAAIAAHAAGAAACELLDRTFLEVAGAIGNDRALAADTESALLAEMEAESTEAARLSADQLARIFRERGAGQVRVALDAQTETELWDLRHAASPILSRLDPRLRSMQFIEDCAVPPPALPAYVRGVRAILAANDTRGVIFGHAGDAHVHVNPLVDVSRPDWHARVARILDEVTALAASLGGTLTGEHGDGRLRTPLMPRVWSDEARRRFGIVKHAFDPKGIFNPGVKVAISGEEALGAIKYDPALPALAPRARAVLDRVERDRAYARSRLELLGEPG
jgi:FAD/FMN-containing dehydrogenase